MTEHEAQDLLYHYLNQKQHAGIVPNIYAYSWESDMLSMTKAEFMHEYEIKVSLSDFRKDAEKAEKHEILKTGSRVPSEYEQRYLDKAIKLAWCNYDSLTKRIIENRPNYFWYACPPDLIPVSEVPAHAGLLYLTGRHCQTVVKDAPRLHIEKVTDRVKRHIITSFVFKYWRMRIKSKDVEPIERLQNV